MLVYKSSQSQGKKGRHGTITVLTGRSYPVNWNRPRDDVVSEDEESKETEERRVLTKAFDSIST